MMMMDNISSDYYSGDGHLIKHFSLQPKEEMPSTRIFVGGLSDKVDRQDLGGKLTHFAPVLSIDLKEKTDPEGNVLQRFAYVNLDATPSQVEHCKCYMITFINFLSHNDKQCKFL